MESSSPFNSPVYKILAGPAAQPFYVHADFLSKSEVLKREIHGRWRESEEKQIIWPHWHVSAVGKFIEWLYTGDFKCLYPTKVEIGGSSYRQNHDSPKASAENVSKTEPRPLNRYFNHYLSANLRLNISSGSTSPQPLPTLYELEWPGSRKFSKLPQAEEYDEWTDDQLWHSEELNYEEVFMTYAELYVMASTYVMDELKNVAWQRLRSVLKRIGVPVPGSLLIEHLANLIHYTFKETGNIGDEEDHLRMLVTTFAALHFTTMKGPEIDSLLVSSSFSDREFVLALTDKIAHQMKYLQSRASIFTSDPELYFLCKSMHAFASEVFQIVVGAEENIFYAHASLLSKSEVLRKEVEGSWKEREERKIVWAHWSIDAVMRFLEWLYTSDYENIYPCEANNTQVSVKEETGATVPHGVKRPAEEPSAESPTNKANRGASNATGQTQSSQQAGSVTLPPSPRETNSISDKALAQASDKLLDLRQISRLVPHLSVKRPRIDTYAKWCTKRFRNCWDFTAPFMTHAGIYIMACHYLLDKLSEMTWQRFRVVMISVGVPTPGTLVLSNLIELIKYVYEETGGCSNDGEELLRQLVSTFAALHLSRIKGPELTSLLMSQTQVSAEFFVDLTDKLARHVSGLEERLTTAEKEVAPLKEVTTPATERSFATNFGKRSRGG